MIEDPIQSRWHKVNGELTEFRPVSEVERLRAALDEANRRADAEFRAGQIDESKWTDPS